MNKHTAFHDAILFLGRRAYSEAELKAKLERKGHDTSQVDQAIERLRQSRYLDDARLAETIVSSGAPTRAEGRLKVKARLIQRGIPPEVAEEAVAAGYAPEEEQTALSRAVDVFFRLYRLPQALEGLNGAQRRNATERMLRRLASFLERRGFPSALIAEELEKATAMLAQSQAD